MRRHRDRSDAKIIDFAAHCHPDDPPENEFVHGFVERDLGAPVWRDMDAIVTTYAEAGLDGAVLSQPYYLGHADLDRVEAANDSLLAAVEGYENLFTLASIPTAAGGAVAAAEFERCLESGFNGGALETKTDGVELHHEAVEPILEVGDQTGAPILVHPKLFDSLHPDALDDTWMLNAVFGRDVALAGSICKVVHTGVLDRYPNLNLVFHHTGGNIASSLGRLHSQLEKFPPDVWSEAPDGTIKSYDAFKRQLEERIFVDTSGYYGYDTVLRSALSAFPTSQLLLGTDFPFETRFPDEFDQFVSSVEGEASEADADRILGENALDLLVNVD